MIKRFLYNHQTLAKLAIVLVGIVFVYGLVIVSPVVAQASKTSACQGINTITGANNPSGCSSGGESLKGAMADVLNILSLIAGFIAVIMIIIGGFRYVVSGGNDQAVAGAKNTILYALIGVFVLALAQAIVHFVIHASGL
jgi:hypothetical protein